MLQVGSKYTLKGKKADRGKDSHLEEQAQNTQKDRRG